MSREQGEQNCFWSKLEYKTEYGTGRRIKLRIKQGGKQNWVWSKESKTEYGSKKRITLKTDRGGGDQKLSTGQGVEQKDGYGAKRTKLSTEQGREQN